MDWAAKIRELRDSHGLNQEEFAQLGECSVATIRAWEKGNRPVTLPTLGLILQNLGSSLSEFFQSKVPGQYLDPRHRELHERLQRILQEDGQYAQGITVNIDVIWEKVIAEARRKHAGPKEKRRKIPA
jgi:transcriptional regulator with XRE-family HTH domain